MSVSAESNHFLFERCLFPLKVITFGLKDVPFSQFGSLLAESNRFLTERCSFQLKVIAICLKDVCFG